ncbi:hypothetical protein ACL7TT_14205 [Microbulbifer sp. 2304DJ12-6]|uniref:hypothetical protein n=1 Tax=Microbulbifer sp. 2304DJ12-6 TaxID=3233340 RepID=UPI0039AF3CD0
MSAKEISRGSYEKTILKDIKILTRIKLSALWTSVMFCYIYDDYLELNVPGKMQNMLRRDDTERSKAGIAIRPRYLGGRSQAYDFSFTRATLPTESRWINIGAELFYTTMMLLILLNGA